MKFTVENLLKHADEAIADAKAWRVQPNGDGLARVRHRDAQALREAARMLASSNRPLGH